jgi:hypothetical protein
MLVLVNVLLYRPAVDALNKDTAVLVALRVLSVRAEKLMLECVVVIHNGAARGCVDSLCVCGFRLFALVLLLLHCTIRMAVLTDQTDCLLA